MSERLTRAGVWKRVGGLVRWSNRVCTASRMPRPMGPPRLAETLVNGLAANPLFWEVLANLHPYLEHDLEKLVEMGGLRFSEF